MKSKQNDEGDLPHTGKVDTAARVVKNSAAMFAAAALAKGGGLIVTILVARYLGASSLGVYAVVLALALLLEVLSPLGQQEVVIRAIARDRSLLFSHWVNASAATLLFGLVFSIILVFIAQLTNLGPAGTVAIYVAAAGLPLGGLNFVAQAVLQGFERMHYQTIGALVGRVLGLLVLWVLLESGAGIWSTFVGRAVFQLTSLLILGRAILEHTKRNNLPRDWHPRLAVCRATISTSIPFAIQRFFADGLIRVNIIILPLLVTLETVGLFNAAYQITQTIAMIIPIVMMAILPIFSRSFKRNPKKSGILADQTLRFLLILVFPFVFIVTIVADKIIHLLYGTGYEASVPVLQLVIWSQVFLAADSVMKQSMIASDNERAMVWRSAISVTANIALTITLSKIYGLFGIAAAVVIASAFLLAMDAHFVAKHISRTNWPQAVGKPFLSAALAGIVAFSLMGHGLALLLSMTVAAYVAFLLLLKVFTVEELSIFRQLFRRLLARANG